MSVDVKQDGVIIKKNVKSPVNITSLDPGRSYNFVVVNRAGTSNFINVMTNKPEEKPVPKAK